MSRAAVESLVVRTGSGHHIVKAPGDDRSACGETVLGPAPVGVIKCPKCREFIAATKAATDARAKQAREWESFRRGDLRWLLDEAQQVVYDRAKAAWGLTGGTKPPEPDPSLDDMNEEALEALPDTTYGALCSRRFGKSTISIAIAAEIAIQRPNSTILYAAKDQADAQKIATAIWRDVFAKTCPDDVKPDYKEHKGIMVFQNGSSITFVGVNDQKAEDIRGYKADFVICDEVGSWQKPNYVITSVVMPAISTTNGNILILTTPASTPNHESTMILQGLEHDGRLSKHTIIESRRLTNLRKAFYLWKAGETKQHALAVVKSGGAILPRTSAARREFFVMFEVDSNALVLPEAREVDFVVRLERMAA